MRNEDQSVYHMDIARLLDDFHLSALADRSPRELSGGEAQRVNLARACASGGRLVMLDEPLTGLDLDLRDDILAKIRQRHQTTPILSVTHDVAEAFQLGAEVIRLHDGKVVAQGPVEEVLAEERLRLLRQLGAETMPLPSTEPFLGG
jgi:molybdate transport system ATP-binding protein